MAKKLLTIVKPPKPVSQMTDAELDDFADRLFDAAAGVSREALPPPDEPGASSER